ncbi:MAG TPA: alpha/beta hydrolase [Actinomycetota bacterium]|jgi:pimeloyl-ACP methyl ester carboxylesterase|nr:alpha/beta hydrolase [Actinomycetota bacterium]
MTQFSHRTIKTNGINMHVAEAAPNGSTAGKPVVFVHGFPELWRSWRKQMPAVAEAGYRAVAPDMRGYGQTDAPRNVTDYDVHHLTGDLCGLLDDLEVDKAVFVGHDWGAWAMWFMTLLHPDRVEALVNISVAYAQRSEKPPMQFAKEVFGDIFFYQLYFQDVGPADEELAKDVRRTVLKFAWSVSGEAGAPEVRSLNVQKVGEGGFLDMLSDPPHDLDWFTDEDLEYFVREFSRTGYFGPLSWYRNIDRNWETTPQLDGAKPQQPVLFIAGSNDPVIRMLSPDPMRETVPNLRDILIVDGPGHWIHMEKPEPVNEAILGFLKDVGY